MKQCPYCREDVKDEAIKCRYCGSAFTTNRVAIDPASAYPDLGPDRMLLVLDRGLIYFAKFILGIVVVIIALGTAYFGFDLNKAREDVDQMQKDVQKAQTDVQEAQKEVQEAKASVEVTKGEVLRIGGEAQTLLEQVRSEAEQTHAIRIALITSSSSKPESPSSANRAFKISELSTLYHVPPGSDGAGQTIGLIELGGGYREEDLNTFFRQMNLRPPRLFSVSVGGARNQPTGSGADGEVTSNIEVAGAIAPKANIVVYFAPNTDTGFAEAIKAAAHDITHKPSIISITWGAAEVNWTEQVRTGLDAALAAAARQGITIVAAAGDNGVTDGVDDGKPHVDFPASSQWVLAVGGTSLVANGGEIASETVWSSGGGGISDVTALPDWQAGANVPLRKDGSRGRGVPDVAAAADPSHGYLAFVGGKQVVFGGTALAAPLWAGLIATINQSLGRNVGYFNRRLYTEIGPANVLRSITIGTNGNGSLQGYSAGPGWNPVAGWGAPDAEKLLMWLREHPG